MGVTAEQQRLLDETWPPRGPCAFCGGPDARHRTWEVLESRHAAGETVAELVADYDQGWSEEAVAPAIEISRAQRSDGPGVPLIGAGQ